LLAVAIYLHGTNRGWAIMAVAGSAVLGPAALFYLIRQRKLVATLCVLLAALWFGLPAYYIYGNTAKYNRCQAIKRDFGRQGLSIHSNACDTQRIVLNTLPGCIPLPVQAAHPNQKWLAVPLYRKVRRSVEGDFITGPRIRARKKMFC
jgi:hypothetical protein